MVAAMLVKSPFSHKALLGLVLADGMVGCWFMVFVVKLKNEKRS
jgi:hypothetical protein